MPSGTKCYHGIIRGLVEWNCLGYICTVGTNQELMTKSCVPFDLLWCGSTSGGVAVLLGGCTD